MPIDNKELNLSLNSPYVDDSNVYNKKTKPIPKPDLNIGVDLKNQFFDSIVNEGTSSTLDISALMGFSQLSLSRDQIYSLIDSMAEDSTIASALELYTEGATETNDRGQIVWCESNDSDIAKTVQFLLDSMNLDKKVYGQMYSLIKYGDLYIRLYRRSDEELDPLKKLFKKGDKEVLNEDLKIKAYSPEDHYTHYVERELDPSEMFELVRLGKTSAYIKANTSSSIKSLMVPGGVAPANINRFNFSFNLNDVIIYLATNFVHAYLEDNSSRVPETVELFLDRNETQKEEIVTKYTVRRGQSLLYNIFKIWRTLKLIENALLLNRVTKSSVVRAIGVEIGDMPKEMVGPHLQGIKSMFELKAAIDTNRSISEYTNPGPVENNIYIPTRDGKGALNIQSVGGDVNVSGLGDLDYFKNAFYGALGIPKQYMGDTDDGAGFNGGQSLSIISSVFAKRVKRFQNAYCQAVTDACNLMLIDMGLQSYVNKFSIRMLAPTTQEESTRVAETANQMQLARDIIDMLGEVEDTSIKLSIIKELLSNIITNPEVIQLLQEYIDSLETQDSDKDKDNNKSIPKEGSSENIDMDMNLDLSNDLSMDDLLGLDNEIDTSSETEENSNNLGTEDSLPSPDELGIGDLTDNNNPEI